MKAWPRSTPRRSLGHQPPHRCLSLAHANIYETCDNYTPAAEFEPTLTDQLADVEAHDEPHPADHASPSLGGQRRSLAGRRLPSDARVGDR